MGVLVYILSGRGRSHLDEWFSKTGVGLGAEHGCFYKHPLSIRDEIRSKVVSNNNGNGGGTTASNSAITSPGGGSISSSSSEAAASSPRNVVFDEETGWRQLVVQTDSSWRDTIRPLFHHASFTSIYY